MTWGVSNSGEKSKVRADVVEKVAGFHAHPDIAEALGKLIDAQKGPNVSVSGSGSDSGCSLSINSYA